MVSQVDQETSVKMANMGSACAILIVMLHSGCSGVTALAVPYFFLAAGYFLAGHMDEPGWWRREVLKRVHSLLIPMWIWGFFSLMLALLLQWGVRLIGYDYHGALMPLGHRVLSVAGLLFMENMGVLWFVRMLFILVVISPLLGGGQSLHLSRLMVCAGAYGWFELSHIQHDELWNFLEYGFSLRGLLYFSAGIYLRRYPIRMKFSRWAIAFLCLTLVMLVGFRASVLVVVPVGMLVLFLLMPSGNVYGHGYAFPVYLLHMNVLLMLSAGLAAVGIRSSTCHALWLVVLRIVVGLVGAMVLAWLIRRFAPRFANVAFGGR